MAEEASTELAADRRFPCTSCGADLRFAPGQLQLVCDHCGAVTEIEGSGFRVQPIKELDLRHAIEAQLPETDIIEQRSSHCPNCGAVVEFDPAVHAAECPFCATPVVADSGPHRQIKPRGVLPFALTEPEARKAMTDWLGSLWFAPGGLVDYSRRGRALQGVYVPYWTFDADTKSSYHGERGTVYYTTETVTVRGPDGRSRNESRRVQHIRWSPASGRVARFFDDILILASKSLPKQYTDGLAPWQLQSLEPYRPEFLAGFRAESYTVPLEEGFGEARAIMDQVIERDVKFDIGGDAQRIRDIDTALGAVTFKHVLLPVWLAAYKYRGRTFRFVVNGQTGRVQGERPWSGWKVFFAALGVAIAVGAAVYLSQYAETGSFRIQFR
ncbi:MAG: primosomal protein N' (replication factor Y) - superfamily II helicase [Paracoccaceae bacterium]